MFFSKFDNFLRKFRLNRILFRLKQKGEYLDIHYSTMIYYPEKMEIKDYIYIGPNAEINALGGIKISSNVIIGPNIIIHSANHNYKNSKLLPYDETFEYREVIIGENVWIGGNVIITPGSIIGEGCIIGAGCVVSGNIPPLSIVIGNPCRVIKTRNAEQYNELKSNGKFYLKKKFNP